MTQMDKEINTLIMNEMGLEVGNGHHIIDQDTGVAMTFRGMSIVEPGCYGGNNSIEFDPHNNKKLMSLLFGYFLDKHSEESDVDVLTYYNVDKGDKGYIECKMSDQSTITSRPYARESLKCADIIIQLNGGESPNLDKYDIVQETTIKTRRSGNNAKNKSNSKTAKNSK